MIHRDESPLLVDVAGRRLGRLLEPGMLQNSLQRGAFIGSVRQALADEISHAFRRLPAPLQLSLENLVILFEGNIAADHVEEQDAQGPNGGADALVAMILDPLGRTVNARA